MTSTSPERIPVQKLHFDWNNARLSEFGIASKTKEAEILSLLWEVMDVQELVQSILASGYFEHEPLIVAEEGGKLVVIEGNRRLAAVKILLDPKLAKNVGYRIPNTLQTPKDLDKLPALISSRNDSWRYLGFKHINGPAKWSGHSKAKYIAQVHRKMKISLEEIAEQIGDRHNTVQRLYRGLMVIEQAEREQVYDREDRYRKRFEFSHLYTGLDYDGIGNFLSIKSKKMENSTPVPKGRIDRLGELCVWLYGSKKEKRKPVVETQNPDLRNLSEVLKNREALMVLRAGKTLSASLEETVPASTALESALLEARRALERARGYTSRGFEDSDDILRLAGTVADVADDMYREMERMKGRAPRRVAES